MLAEEVVRDVSSAQMLQERHNQLKAEIDAREENFSSVVATGRGLIDGGHFASQEVGVRKCLESFGKRMSTTVYELSNLQETISLQKNFVSQKASLR